MPMNPILHAHAHTHTHTYKTIKRARRKNENAGVVFAVYSKHTRRGNDSRPPRGTFMCTLYVIETTRPTGNDKSRDRREQQEINVCTVNAIDAKQSDT